MAAVEALADGDGGGWLSYWRQSQNKKQMREAQAKESAAASTHQRIFHKAIYYIHIYMCMCIVLYPPALFSTLHAGEPGIAFSNNTFNQILWSHGNRYSYGGRFVPQPPSFLHFSVCLYLKFYFFFCSFMFCFNCVLFLLTTMCATFGLFGPISRQFY